MASVGSLTSLAMLAIITAVFRLIGVSPCLMPRIRSGIMMDNAGASTDCKVIEGVQESDVNIIHMGCMVRMGICTYKRST